MAKNLMDYAAYAVSTAEGLDWSPAFMQAFSERRALVIEHLGTPYLFKSAVTVPAKGHVIGEGMPDVDFTYAPGTVSGLTVGSRAKASDLVITGPGKATASKGLNISGDHQVLDNVECKEFGTIWYGNNPNTYCTVATNCTFHHGGVGVSMPLDGSLTAGERISFYNSTIGNNDVGIDLKGSFLDTFWYGCSFDYNVDMGTFDNGQHHLIGGHIETNSVTTTQGFVYRKKNGAQVNMEGVRHGQVGIEYAVDRATEGTSGWIRYTNCPSNAKSTGGASTVSSSSIYVQFAANERTKTFNTPFASRTCYPTVAASGMTANAVRAIATPAVTMDPASNLVTLTLPASLSQATGFIVNFG